MSPDNALRSDRPRRVVLAGFFQTEAEARDMALALEDLSLANERDSIPWPGEQRRYRVFLTGNHLHPFPAHLPELPLQRWPSRIELVQRALERVRELDTNRAVFHSLHLNPPLDEAHVRELEARSGITLPEEYRLFLSRVGNGGHLGGTHYMTLDEVLEHNSAPAWSSPLPAELRDLTGKDYIQVGGEVDDFRPGLLRISHWSYDQLTVFLTSDGSYYELWKTHDEELPVCVWAHTGWLQDLWVGLTNDLEPLEIMLTKRKGGAMV